MIRIVTTLVLTMLTCDAAANSIFEPGKVSKIILHDWGKVLVYIEGGLRTDEPCNSKGSIVLDRDNQHFNEMYSALLAAYHSGTWVGGWVNGCDTRHNTPILTRLDLMPK